MTRINSPGIGQAELELLQYIADTGPLSVREAADGFGAEKGYVRTTLLQMMERLRKKGYLDREPDEGIFKYRSTRTRDELQQHLVQRFVEGSLSGSVSPFVAFLAGDGRVSDEEFDQLKQLVADLEERRRRQ